MSESAGPVGTFTSPSTATGGLQGYHLERRVKNLAPETGVLFRKRLMAARRRRSLKKDAAMSDPIDQTLKAMLGTLAKSVTDIVAAGGGDQPKLLEQSFGEFGSELNKAVLAHIGQATEALKKQAPEELFKDLGTVGKVASMVGTLAERIDCIKQGKDYPGGEEVNEPASEDVCVLLDDCLQSAELAMRSAVNEHVQVAEDGDEGDEGEHVLVLKSADAPDDLSKGIRVKTALPEELAKFAADPAFLDQALLDRAAGTLLAFGVPEDSLNKLLDGGDLAKADVAEVDPEAEMETAAGDDQGDPMQQLVVLGRLLAASMIQLDGFMRLVEGDGAEAEEGAEAEVPSTDEENTDPGAAASTDEAKPAGNEGTAAGTTTEDPNKKENPFAKSAEYLAMQKQMGEMQKQLAKALGMPADAKAVLIPGAGGTMAKSADSALGEDDGKTLEEISAEIEKITDNAKRAEALIKLDFDIRAGRVLVKG